MRQLLRLAILLAAVNANATGLWLNGQEQIASSSSVVTNGTTNIVQHITNSAFSSSIGGWSVTEGSVVASWYSNGSTRAMVVAGDLTFPFTLQYSTCSPAVTQTNAIITFRYWYADTNASVNVTVSDSFSHELGNSEMANGGAFVTSVVSISLPLPTNLTGIVLGFGSPASVATAMLFEAVSVTSVVVNSSITTNSGSGTSGPTLDGIVPLSTNRHLWTDGRPSS